jgi:hypothetical protein
VGGEKVGRVGGKEEGKGSKERREGGEKGSNFVTSKLFKLSKFDIVLPNPAEHGAKV